MDVHASYGPVPVLYGVSLRTEPGRLTALLGRNGAGKTSTLRVASGLLPVTRGEMLIDGERVTGRDAEDLARAGLCHVPEGRGILPGLSVAENLTMGTYTRRLGAAQRRAALDEALDLFPVLGERLRQHAETLSGGEQQMLVLARAVLGRPRVLLVDEPSTGLSPVLVEEVYETFERLVAAGLTLLVVEQYVTLALRMASFVYLLEKGRVVAAGEPDRLVSDHSIVDAYFSTPAATGGTS